MLLEKIFFNIASPILYMDPEFHLILVNKAFAAWAGHPPEFFVGKRYFDLYPDTRREAIFTRAVQTAERYFALQEDFQHAADDTYWDWTLQPVTDDHGKVIGLILNLVEVTEQKLARQQWRLYRKKPLQNSRRSTMRNRLPGHSLLTSFLTGCTSQVILVRRLSSKSKPRFVLATTSS
ncbi:MAG: PAS domain-containing protein [Desulfatiglandaceae bacterium]